MIRSSNGRGYLYLYDLCRYNHSYQIEFSSNWFLVWSWATRGTSCIIEGFNLPVVRDKMNCFYDRIRNPPTFVTVRRTCTSCLCLKVALILFKMPPSPARHSFQIHQRSNANKEILKIKRRIANTKYKTQYNQQQW